MGFRGVYYNSIDTKGRVSIPAKFREELEEGFGDQSLVVTQDRGGVVAYPTSVWQKVVEKFELLDKDQFWEDLYTYTITPATDCCFDKQGRIQLPQSLRENCQMATDGMRDVVVVGGDNKIEVWSKAKYTEMLEAAERRLAASRDKRFDLGL
ncbi:MAG: division/cell wall cluster transcriptional repressor MraZ [Deltaproteobacteria bacterium]|jgi:MraZ protein|nr:division/cell wall cluster transcriptional repressor MraZ [Deltaproteobacteria bacterium]